MHSRAVIGLASVLLLGACAQGPSEQGVASRGSEPGEATEPAPSDEPTTSTAPTEPSPTSTPDTTTSSTAPAPVPTTATTIAKPAAEDPCARPTVAEFPLGVAGAKPRELAVAPDGTVWFTDNGGAAIGRLAPDGTVQTFPLTLNRQPAGIALGPGGEVWFTQYAWYGAGRAPQPDAAPPDPATIGPPAIGRINADGTMTEFPLPTVTGNRLGDPESGALPRGIVAGPDGAMWFTEAGADQIGRIAPDGTITEYPLPSQTQMHAFPDRLVVGPEGALWFSETLYGGLGRIDVNTRTITEHVAEPRNSGVGAVTLGPDGALWFGGWGPTLNRMTTAGKSSSFPLSPAAAQIDALITGPDGRFWLTDIASTAIVRVTTKGAVSKLMTVPGVTAANWEALGGMAVGDDGAVWLATPATGRILRISCRS